MRNRITGVQVAEYAGKQELEQLKPQYIKEQKNKEEETMNKTMKIEGMMCGHCEARVKKALESLSEVTEAVVSHTTGTAEVRLQSEVADSVLKQAVEAQDYKVLEIQ